MSARSCHTPRIFVGKRPWDPSGQDCGFWSMIHYNRAVYSNVRLRRANSTGRDKQTAPCKGNPDPGIQEIWGCGIRNSRNLCFGNPESWALESPRNTAQGSRNVTNDWNSESKLHWERIGIHYLESGIHGVESRILNCLGFPYMGETNELIILNDILSSLFVSRLSLRFCTP